MLYDSPWQIIQTLASMPDPVTDELQVAAPHTCLTCDTATLLHAGPNIELPLSKTSNCHNDVRWTDRHEPLPDILRPSCLYIDLQGTNATKSPFCKGTDNKSSFP